MKLIVIVRTRNNIQDIERFVHCYQWADQILVADGGSTDGTFEIAQTLPKVQARQFLERVFSPNGRQWRNPTGKHINFLIKWAQDEGADWIIFDDIDCIPNYKLQHEGREFLESLQFCWDFVSINRVYIYNDDQYFEILTKPDGQWTTGFWAWRAKLYLHAKETDPWEEDFDLVGYREFSLLPPFCLLHYFYPNHEVMQKKLSFYKECELPLRLDPLEYGGALHKLESWMRYDKT